MNTKMQSKHTPGPLNVVSGQKDNVPSWKVYDEGFMGRPVAYFEKEADARLYAAAPELLEAVKMVKESWDGCDIPSMTSTQYRQLEAAILKATEEK